MLVRAVGHEPCPEGVDGYHTLAISVNCGGSERVLPAVADPVREVGRLLRTYADASDVTVSIELANDHGRLLVALEAASAFVGLVTAGGIYQYFADKQAEGKRQFIIGRQPTSIDKRYVLPVTAAIELLTPWLAAAALLTAPGWELR